MIEGKTLRLVAFTYDHITPRYLGWLNNPDITKYMRQSNRVHTRESARLYLEATRAADDLFLAVIHREYGHIGNLTASYDDLNSRVDLSILLGEHQGCGYGLEAWTLMMANLLKTYRKVTAGTVVTNNPMLRIMHKSGMIEDGRRRRHDLRNGEMVDVVHYARFRE